MLYYVVASTFAHLLMLSYKLLTEIAICFYQLNLKVNKMFVDKIQLTRQCNTESAECQVNKHSIDINKAIYSHISL